MLESSYVLSSNYQHRFMQQYRNENIYHRPKEKNKLGSRAEGEGKWKKSRL